ncbi:hypothetical protein [Candidatus Bathycorpusculum sp.]|uniref:hypothetical protein n=1 Tax=Candidatus Bathycorpusculum sp. TaxID=2994959 RepID=UPI00281E57CC|nr:hypothetical protein [Candidatus Termitimicrobium sp.]
MQYNNELQNRVYRLAKPLDLKGLLNQYWIQKDKINRPQTTQDQKEDQAVFAVIVDLLKERGVMTGTLPNIVPEA